MTVVSYVYRILVLLALVALSACAGGGRLIDSQAAGVRPADAGDGLSPARQVDLESALAEVAAFQPPAGGDRELYGLLADELARVLVELNGPGGADVRGAASLEPAEWDRAWCVQAASPPAGNSTIYWRGRHLGDYNLDGLVTASDLTPLGIHYGKTVGTDDDGLPAEDGDNEWAAVVDGSDDGLVGISDITPIGQNYGSQLAGYRIYLGTTTDEATFTWDAAYQPADGDPGAAWTVPFSTGRAAGDVQRYSYQFTRPALNPGELLYARVVSWDGSAEGSPLDIPVLDGPHAMFRCDACHVMLDMAFRGTDPTCGACHSVPPEAGGMAWDDVPGLHGQCLSCHASHGFAVAPPESACTACHSSIATAVGTAGMPECLGCHEAAHLPETQPGTAACQACHPVPPDVVGGAWVDAPGLHGTCGSCHVSHGFSVPVLVDVCDDCHEALITGGHGGGSTDCLSCHQSAHIPETALTGVSCTDCHLNPPEDLAAEWTDAPGSHGQCILCHDTTEHGLKPVPAESVCADCHEDTISGTHSTLSGVCLDCHVHPHLPELDFQGASCTDCHPNPPEDLAAEWTDAPGNHGQCALCHDTAEHGLKPVPPESACAGCHEDTLAGTHSTLSGVCLDCHVHPHLPEFEIQGASCTECHPNPPEDPEAAWEDAPGQHSECGLCHALTVHGDKPVPPESVCADCHSDLGAGHGGGSTNCLGCHTWSHLPKDAELHATHPSDIAHCGACHGMHGGLDPDREKCMKCHTDKAEHYPATECIVCHTAD